MRNLPIVIRAFEKLDTVAAAWLHQDFDLAKDMDTLSGYETASG